MEDVHGMGGGPCDLTKLRIAPFEKTWKRFQNTVFCLKKLEEKKSEEALLLVQKKSSIYGDQNERDEARRLQRSGSSRRMKEVDSQDLLSFESCRSSAVDRVEEMSLESPRKRQDVQ